MRITALHLILSFFTLIASVTAQVSEQAHPDKKKFSLTPVADEVAKDEQFDGPLSSAIREVILATEVWEGWESTGHHMKLEKKLGNEYLVTFTIPNNEHYAVRDKVILDEINLSKSTVTFNRITAKYVFPYVGQILDNGRKITGQRYIIGEDGPVIQKGITFTLRAVRSVSQEVSSAKKGVSNLERRVRSPVEVPKENFRKVHEIQTRSVNETFTHYYQNRVTLELFFEYKSGISQTNREETFSTDTVLMVDGNFVFALVHAEDSPFSVETSPRKLISVTGQISSPKFERSIPVKEVAFMDDPRILIVPLYVNPLDLLSSSGLELFKAPVNPFLFDDAVVVDIKDGRYGQTKCLRDENDERYIEVDEKHFAFWDGAFNLGKGDLVFSQKGELLGIMVNSDYAYYLKNLGGRIQGGSRIFLGLTFDSSKTNELLMDMNKKLSGLSKNSPPSY